MRVVNARVVSRILSIRLWSETPIKFKQTQNISVLTKVAPAMKSMNMKCKIKCTRILNNLAQRNLTLGILFWDMKVSYYLFIIIERRKRKERKAREKEQKKAKALNGDDTPTGGVSSSAISESGMTNTPGGEDDEVESSSSSSSSSEESKDQKTKQNTTKKQNPRSNNDEGEVSSITTRKSKTERNHFIIRMAIDEKFIPHSIKNLRYAAYFIFLILLLLAG